MKFLIPFISILLITIQALAQAPSVKMWDRSFGGTGYEIIYVVRQTADNGYILGGQSSSGDDGDRTQPSWGRDDIWVIKIDSIGNKQWDKRFGGYGTDRLYDLQPTIDGGFILGGGSNSEISGDKTQPNWDTTNSYIDYWIVKIDSVGNKQWDKRFGGINHDILNSLQQTHDKGFILGGYSHNGMGGDKTEPSWGGTDYWIVKIDSVGNKQWDKRYGGFASEFLQSLKQTHDRGYILGGWSFSGISGDKTQPGWGDKDYWIVKIDSVGNKQWDKRFGGTGMDWLNSLQLTTDGGYILGGYSVSDASGDKTTPNRDTALAGSNFWMVKTDSVGNKQWDNAFGGFSHEDDYGNISQTSDKGYLLAGTSYSPASGDKSEDNFGEEQTWIVKTDSLGNKQWDKTIFTTDHVEDGFAIQTKDGCFVIANTSEGFIGGYKSEFSLNRDYWIVKFCSCAALKVTTHVTDVTCFGARDGTAKAVVSDGIPPYSFRWSDGQTADSVANLPTGVHWVIVTDVNGCKDSSSVTIGEPAAPLSLINVYQIEATCYNGSDGMAGVLANGGTEPYDIVWSNGMTGESTAGLSANIYTVTVTDANSCTAATSLTIEQPTELISTIASVTAQVTCLGATNGAAKIFALGGTPPYTFVWSSGQTGDSPTDFPAGTHTVTVTDANGCTATTSITIGEGELPCTGIQENLLNNISLYPNPTDGSVVLEIPSLQGMESLSITLYDTIGKQVFKQTFGESELIPGISLDLNDLPGSIFFLNVTTEAGSRVMKVAKY